MFIIYKCCINIGNRNSQPKNSKHDWFFNFSFWNIGNRNNGQWNIEQQYIGSRNIEASSMILHIYGLLYVHCTVPYQCLLIILSVFTLPEHWVVLSGYIYTNKLSKANQCWSTTKQKAYKKDDGNAHFRILYEYSCMCKTTQLKDILIWLRCPWLPSASSYGRYLTACPPQNRHNLYTIY